MNDIIREVYAAVDFCFAFFKTFQKCTAACLVVLKESVAVLYICFARNSGVVYLAELFGRKLYFHHVKIFS